MILVKGNRCFLFFKDKIPSTMPSSQGDAQGPLKTPEIKIGGHNSTFPMTEYQSSLSWHCSDQSGHGRALIHSCLAHLLMSLCEHHPGNRWSLLGWAQAASSCALARYNSPPPLLGGEKSYMYCNLMEMNAPCAGSNEIWEGWAWQTGSDFLPSLYSMVIYS